jgi:hypothetical protein
MGEYSVFSVQCSVGLWDNRGVKWVWRILFIVAVSGGVVGCQSGRFAQSKLAGREIVIAARVYTLDALARYPDSLTNLVTERLLEPLPKCRCQDGHFRDFLYIAGFTIADSEENVVLTTPPEFDSKRAIIFRLNGTADVVSRDVRDSEVEKSRRHIADRGNPSP